ncbi:hypothetical protein [Streptomyces sp. NPDC047028]|uniref:hypothetical protein n=1 Tax=Streptomyces sp. NPDC047028 TaxID=3155793 RepID=UPI00340FF934
MRGRLGGGGGHEDVPAVPDAVWQRFLDDSERAIRRSAPREPSARERAAAGAVGAAQASEPVEPVGELWQPEEARPGRAWRELDGRDRCRRLAGVLGTAAAIVMVLGAVSYLPHGGAGPAGPAGGVTTRQTQKASDPLAGTSPTPDAAGGTASPAAPDTGPRT